MNRVQKTLSTKGLVEYSERDTFIYTFVTMYGYSGLFLQNDHDLSVYLNRSLHSVRKQMSNIRFLMGSKTNILTDYSELQLYVFNFLKEFSYHEVREYVKELLNNDYEIRKVLLKKKGYDIDYLKLINQRDVKIV